MTDLSEMIHPISESGYAGMVWAVAALCGASGLLLVLIGTVVVALISKLPDS